MVHLLSFYFSIYCQCHRKVFDSLRIKESLVKSNVAECITNAAPFKFTNLYNQGFPGGAVVKNPLFQRRKHKKCRLRRSPGGDHDNPLQYSCLENSTDRSLAGYSPWDCRVGCDWAHTHTHTHSRDNSALDSILLIKYKLLLELILILRLISNHWWDFDCEIQWHQHSKQWRKPFTRCRAAVPVFCYSCLEFQLSSELPGTTRLLSPLCFSNTFTHLPRAPIRVLWDQ